MVEETLFSREGLNPRRSPQVPVAGLQKPVQALTEELQTLFQVRRGELRIQKPISHQSRKGNRGLIEGSGVDERLVVRIA